jgi:hypothetical protein
MRNSSIILFTGGYNQASIILLGCNFRIFCADIIGCVTNNMIGVFPHSGFTWIYRFFVGNMVIKYDKVRQRCSRLKGLLGLLGR